VLGVGGMGVVVAATHLQLDQPVALKFLLEDALKNKDVVARFAREARAAARIQSEHVARVIDVGTLDSGSPYMVMEYLQGSDLARVLQDKERLPFEEAVGYIMQACEAIAEAHAANIVHRDLKPANLFLAQRADKRSIIKVLDFGISKATGRSEDASLTRTSTIMGSPLYMSPEQMVASKNVDARCDIWALGIILYELITGATPFVADSMTEIIAQVLQTPPQLPPLAARVPPALSAVIMRCLEKEAARRFQNVSELVTALAPFAPRAQRQTAERVSRVLGTPNQPIVSWRPESQLAPAGPAQVATNASWDQTRTGSEAAKTGAKPSRARRTAVAIVGVVALIGGAGVVALRRPLRDADPTLSGGARSSAAAAVQSPTAPASTVDVAAPTAPVVLAPPPAMDPLPTPSSTGLGSGHVQAPGHAALHTPRPPAAASLHAPSQALPVVGAPAVAPTKNPLQIDLK
jgi:eukaryotic-like serine/threonine-protein kinase